MTQRPPRLLLLLTLLAWSCGPASPDDSTSPAEPTGGRPPDLILVVVDTLRADHLSTYGYHRPTAPVLDGLAGRGVVFEDVTAQSSWTQPSMASMLTGRHMFANASRLPSAAASLAERLKAAGYETAAFVANPAVSRVGHYDRGFDSFITRDDTGGQTWDARDLEAAVHDWLDAHPPGDAPRFLYLHFLDPHWPYEPETAELDGRPLLPEDVLAAWDAELPETPAVAAAREADRQAILEALDAYDREIVDMDRALGRLMERLGQREHGLVYASDHGECLWERRHHQLVVETLLEREGRDPASATLWELFFRDHSYHMFGELLDTPLVAYGPGLPAGQRSPTPVENVDILPTLLRMAGLPDDPSLDGRALQDVLAGTAAPRELVYAHSKEATVVRRVEDDLKLIFPTDTGFYFGMPIMLFDLGEDPHERRNLWGEDTGAMRDLTRHHGRALKGFDLFDGESFEVDDAAHRAEMAALGYVGPGFEAPVVEGADGGHPRPDPAAQDEASEHDDEDDDASQDS